MTQNESLIASEYLSDLLSSDPHLTRRAAVEALIDTFAFTSEEAEHCADAQLALNAALEAYQEQSK